MKIKRAEHGERELRWKGEIKGNKAETTAALCFFSLLPKILFSAFPMALENKSWGHLSVRITIPYK